MSVHLTSILDNLSIARPRQSFIANALFPSVPVKKQYDTYYIFDAAGEARRVVDDNREKGSTTNLIDQEYTTDTYACTGHALAEKTPIEDIENSDTPISLLQDAMDTVVDELMVRKEVRAKAALDAALTSNQTDSAAFVWTGATGVPVADINAGITAIESYGGGKPNVMTMDSISWRALKNNAEIIERVVGGGTNDNPAEVSKAGVAALFDLERIEVSTAIKNTAVKGQSASDSRVWGTDVYLAHVASVPGLKNPTMGMEFNWQIPKGQYIDGWRVKNWYDEDIDSFMTQVMQYYNLVVTAATRGYRISGVTA